MAFPELFQEVLALQADYSSSNTPAMQRRGQLIRTEIPNELKALSALLQREIGLEVDDLLIEGRDGTGMKSAVPWVRFGSAASSPSANSGWYCVYLVHPQATGVYLCLSHASTIWTGTDFRPRKREETEPLMLWSRDLLRSEIAADGLSTQIDLASFNDLAAAYEGTTTAYRFYATDQLPDDAVFRADILLFARMLARVYDAERMRRSPEAVEAEFRDAQEAVARVSSGTRRRHSGQGIGLTANERRAVELHAMKFTREHLVAEGFSLKDVSASHPFDFEATRGTEKIIVEVKGTTGLGSSILLTSGEVDAHMLAYPNNALVVVHSIDLDRSKSEPRAAGGVLEIERPWRLVEEALRATAYQYRRS